MDHLDSGTLSENLSMHKGKRESLVIVFSFEHGSDNSDICVSHSEAITTSCPRMLHNGSVELGQ